MVAIFWLLFAVAAVASGHSCHEGHCDASSMVQLKAEQADKQDPAVDCAGWKLGSPGESCTETCGADFCTQESLDKQNNFSLTGNELKTLINQCFQLSTVTVRNDGESRRAFYPGVFYQPYNGVVEPTQFNNPQFPPLSSNCNASFDKPADRQYVRRVCFCVSSAPVTGDPHIKTLRGDHYTLLKSGTFLAWSFQDIGDIGTSTVPWRLLASYSGAKFTTAGLLLEGPVGVMELTAQDCQWRRKEAGQWHNVTLGVHGDPGYVEVIDLNRTVKGHLPVGSKMFLKKVHEEHTKKVAKLVTHCRPGLRLDFMVSIYDPDELQHMGGELGAPKHGRENQVHFLSSQHISMQTDSEFEVATPWLTLGGSEEAEAYLKARLATTPTSLLQTNTDCSEAEQICSKHVPKESEAFGDCIFDVCNGDEADADAAAEMLAETS